MKIRQGDVFWIDLGAPIGSEPGYRRPHVVIQGNLYNNSGLDTVIVCALTTNLKRVTSPENVLLRRGEANLPKQSMVVVSQLFTVDKRDLIEKIGSLSRQRIHQILKGIRIMTEPSRQA